MPDKLKRCVKAVKASKSKYNPWAVCIKSTGLKPEHSHRR